MPSQRRRRRGRFSADSNDGHWRPYPAAHTRRPQAQDPQPDRLQHTGLKAQAPTPRTDTAIDIAYKTLFSLIDYGSLAQSPPPLLDSALLPQHEILADSLNYIEHLENVPISRSARTTLSYTLNKKLKYKVPEQYFVDAGVQRQRFRVQAFVPSPLSVARAVIEWIKELQLRKQRKITHQKRVRMRREGEIEEGEIVSGDEDGISDEEDRKEATGKSVEDGMGSDETDLGEDSGKTAEGGMGSNETGSDLSESQQRVEKFMDKIEQWIHLWQTGKLQAHEWFTMKDCIDLPDQLGGRCRQLGRWPGKSA